MELYIIYVIFGIFTVGVSHAVDEPSLGKTLFCLFAWPYVLGHILGQLINEVINEN